MATTSSSGGVGVLSDDVMAVLGRGGVDISVPVDPHRKEGGGVGCFHLPPPSATPATGGSWVGAVSAGASVNCPVASLCFHANGTHTECVGHILPQHVSLRDMKLGSIWARCVVLSVKPCKFRDDPDTYPAGRDDDDVISQAVLKEAAATAGVSLDPSATTPAFTAVVIRTLPNPETKLTRDHSGTNPPYFTKEASALLMEAGLQHLLVDLPSVDREDDGGHLVTHRTVFGIPLDTDVRADPPVDESSLPSHSITELCFVPDRVPDGPCVLNLQVSTIALDAAPSRPVLYV